MKKKKINLKGFTLIELLAVIVILAIIALIAVPQILKILNKSRLSAAEDTTYGIVKSAETYVSNFLLKNSGTMPSENLVFNCNGTSCDLETSLTGYELEGLEKLEFKGTTPKGGILIISNSGNDIQASLVINNYGCSYINGKSECSQLTGPTSYTPTESDAGYIGVLKVVYLDSTNLDKGCSEKNINSDTETKIGCMKWYAYADDGTNYTMILDHNTTATIDNWNDRNTQLSNDIIGWGSELNSRLIIADEVNTITGNIEFDLTNAGYYYFDTKTTTASSERPNNYGWLFDRTYSSCKSRGCLNDASGNVTYGYWTDTPQSSTAVWFVNLIGDLGNTMKDYADLGIRPVITVPKNKIS